MQSIVKLHVTKLLHAAAHESCLTCNLRQASVWPMRNLQSLLQDRGLRQKDLADALGVSDPSVSRWATRASDIPVRFIEPIATLLGVPVAEVLALALALPQSTDADIAQ